MRKRDGDQRPAGLISRLRDLAIRWVKPRVGDDVWSAVRKIGRRATKVGRQFKPEPAQKAAETPKPSTVLQLAAQEGVSIPLSLRKILPEFYSLIRPNRARVAIIQSADSVDLVALVRQCHPGAQVTAITDVTDPSTLHAVLSARGPWDAIIDASMSCRNSAGLFADLFFHLRRGGRLGLAHSASTDSPSGQLLSHLARLNLKNDTEAVRAAIDDDMALSRAISRLVITDSYVVAESRAEGLAKLRESEMTMVIEQSDDRVGSEVGAVEPETFEPRSVIRDHRSTTQVRAQSPILVPRMTLRDYHDVLCVRGQLTVKDNLVLPATYRHHLRPRLLNRMTTELGPRFVQLRPYKLPTIELAGTYFHFDSEWPGHFGHVLSEQISRLWAWESAREMYPDLRILLSNRHGHRTAQPFEYEILEAFEVAREDVVVIDGSARVERLVAATPMLSMPEYVSPRIAATWNRIAVAVSQRADDRPLPRRFFCGRRKETRLCNNSVDVEQVFSDAGFEIVFPETLPFSSQVALFQRADVVAGYAGSALFTLSLCPEPKRVLMLSSEAYTAKNEYLIAAVAGHEMDVFWSESDEARPNSNYTFDFSREGRALSAVLADLS